MTDKVQKIREEVERLKIQNETYVDKEYTESEKWSKHGTYHVLFKLLDFIDSLPEEPVSEDLEEAAKRYGTKKHPMSKIGTNESACDFKAGAKWQREQMIKDAVDGEVVKDSANNLYIGKAKVNKNNFKFGDKVKLLVLKED